MRLYPFPDTKLWRSLQGLFLFALLLLARDTMLTTAVLGFYPAQLLMLALVGLMGIAFLAVNRRDLKAVLKDPRMLLLAAATAICVLPMVLKGDWQLMYLSVRLCIWIGIFISYFADMQQVSKVYVGVLCGLGLYSLLATYLLRILPDRGLLDVPVFRNNAGYDFYNFFLCFPGITYVKGRNFGIFREPGVYQYFLLLGLFLNNYYVCWRRSWQLWTANGILALTMLSTFATGGVIEMGLLAVLIFLDKKWYRDKRLRLAAILLVVLVLCAGILIVVQQGDLYVELVGMLTKFTDNPESTGGRIGAILTDTQAFFRHPLLGGQLAQVLHAVVDNTTSTMLMFAIFGIFGGLLHTLSWVCLVWDKNRSWVMNLALLVVMFMSFNTQNLIADVFFWLLPVMALALRGLPLPEKKR